MRKVEISPAAAAALADVLEYSLSNWGEAQAIKYNDRLLTRVRALARGEPPHARSCSYLLQGKRDANGLCYSTEDRHIILLRETADKIEVLDFIHQSRDILAILDRLLG